MKTRHDWLSPLLTRQPFAASRSPCSAPRARTFSAPRARTISYAKFMVFLDGRPVNKPEVMIGAARSTRLRPPASPDRRGEGQDAARPNAAPSLVLAVTPCRRAIIEKQVKACESRAEALREPVSPARACTYPAKTAREGMRRTGTERHSTDVLPKADERPRAGQASRRDQLVLAED